MMKDNELHEIRMQIQDGIILRQEILSEKIYIEKIKTMANRIVDVYQKGNALLLCGNGGSAGDAQHLAGEMVARFKMERKALPALALNTNSSIVTAIGNDYEYNIIFERQVEAFGHNGDILIAISTSGNSESVVRAMQKAKSMHMCVIALLGKDGGRCRELADISIVVPSWDTPRIQEIHIMIGHIICDLVEKKMFGLKENI